MDIYNVIIIIIINSNIYLYNSLKRPSYLYINQILRDVLDVKCVLGLTGSLTKETQISIIKMLNIPKENVISGNLLRNNIRLTISKDPER